MNTLMTEVCNSKIFKLQKITDFIVGNHLMHRKDLCGRCPRELKKKTHVDRDII